MALVTLNDVLKPAREEGYGVGAFDTCTFTLTEGIVQAAEDTGKPVILMLSGFLFDRDDAQSMLDFNLDRVKKSPVPIVYHLDHGSYDQCINALHAGCSSVMYDGSKLSYEENVENTKKIVEMAHTCGATVEAEIGHVAAPEGNPEGSVADTSKFTRPEDAERFAKETGVDALAVAFGTVHGVYRGEPHLELDLLREIRDRVDIPLVMHGGSGLSEQDFKNAIAAGICKVNFFTGMSLAAIGAMRTAINDSDGKIRYINLYDTELNAIKDCVKTQMDIFGTKSLF